MRKWNLIVGIIAAQFLFSGLQGSALAHRYSVPKDMRRIEAIQQYSREKQAKAAPLTPPAQAPAGDLVPNPNTKAFVIESAKAYTYDTGAVRSVTDYRVRVKNYEGPKLAFLTFDDGPNHVITPKVLDILKKEQVHATFFLVGRYVNEDTKPLLERMYNEGHSIALHSFNHNYGELYPGRVANAEAVRHQAQQWVERVRSVLGPGYHPTTWRYPGGHMSWKNLNPSDNALREMGMEWIDWNAGVGDGSAHAPKTVEAMMATFQNSVKASGNAGCLVILMHDAAPKKVTAATLPSIIQWLKSQGYQFGILG